MRTKRGSAWWVDSIGRVINRDGVVATVADDGEHNGKENAALIAAAPDLLRTLKEMNHMGGDERGGYCICPKNDGSAPDKYHATVCVDARAAIEKARGEKEVER